MRNILILTIALICIQKINGQTYEPIKTQSVSVVDTFHNHFIVEDPYRWLEYFNNQEVQDWIEAQVKISDKYLKRIYNQNFMGISKYGATEYDLPRKQGDYYLMLAYKDDIGQAALWYKKAINHTWDLLVDPTYIDRKNNVSIDHIKVSPDSKYVAFQFNRNGSDWSEIGIVNARTGVMLTDNIKGLRFSGIEWHKDGFYYTTSEKIGGHGVPVNHKLFFHQLNTSQGTDQLIYTNKKHPLASHWVTVSSDMRFTIINEYIDNKGITNIFYIDHEATIPGLRPLIVNVGFKLSIIDVHQGKVIAKTNKDDCNGMIVKIDPANPFQWETIAQPFDDAILTGIVPFTDRLLTIYKTPFYPIITIYSYNGDVLHTLPLPVGTSTSGFNANYTDKEIYYAWSSYTIPKIVYKLDIETFQTKLNHYTEVTFDFDKIEYFTAECPTPNGETLPITMVYEKGLERNSNHPVLLETYGGYGSLNAAHFDPGIVHFIKKGGVYAYVNVRGDGTKGAKWARAGKRLNKQQTIDDLITASEYMIKEKYTKPKMVGIKGGSHGGMVVAAAAIQRPDLFGAVVSMAGVFDMIRFEHSAVGVYNTDEFGTIADSTDFANMYSYSPYHNIKEDVNYPSMLITTGDNDERVPPYHAYKFLARLQSRQAQTNPILLLHEKNAGHYGADYMIGIFNEKANIFGFLLNELYKSKD